MGHIVRSVFAIPRSPGRGVRSPVALRLGGTRCLGHVLRRPAAWLSLLLLGLTLLTWPAAAQDYVPGTVLVRWKPAVKGAAHAEAMAPLGASVLATFDLIGVERLSVPAMSVPEAVARLTSDPRVEYAEPDYLWSIERAPNDPRYPEQYGVHNTGQTGGLAGADIGAEAVWDRFTGDPQLLIADLDTGAEYDHPDLEANIWTNPGELAGNGIDDDQNGYVDDVHGYDFFNHDGDPRDDNGHGTHTAGTIAAVGNNNEGVSGVVWRGRLMILKFLGASGSGPTSAAVEALLYSIRMGVRITNNSWNGGFYSRALEDAVIAAGDAGQLFVAAAGNARTNNDATPSYPAALSEDCVLTVAATDNADQLAGFSNYGATTVDLAAPGVDILSTVPGRAYRQLSGTSMAAPHVTGAAALLLGRFPSMAAAEVKSRLIRFVDVRVGLVGRCVSGGRLNLALAAADPDSIAAGSISDLRVVAPGSNSVDLAWTATGDDGTTGTATTYELRFSTTAFTAAEFADATLASAPRPRPSGSAETFRVRGLASGTTYWLALRARDEFGNAGGVSGVVSFTTLPPPDIALAPASVSAATTTGSQVTRTFEIANDSPGTLEWSAPRPVLEFAPAVGSAQLWPEARAAKGDPDEVPHAPQLANFGGPDSLGYRWVDSRDPQGPVFQWVDIAQPVNQLSLSGDEAVTSPIPVGFSFPLYGRRFTHIKVCTNGYLQFGNDGPAFVNNGLPTVTGPRNMIAPFWDDLHFGSGAKRAFLRFDGTRCIVSWIAVPRYNDVGSIMTFQTILYPSGEVRFQYLRMQGFVSGATVGVQDSTRSVGLTVAYNQDFVRDSLAVRIVPLRQWLTVEPSAGFLRPGERQTVQLRMDASGLGSQRFSGRAHIVSNAGTAPDTAVTVSFDVAGAPDIVLSRAALDFGPHFTGSRDTLSVTVANGGVDPLEVARVLTDRAVFTIEGAGFTLLPGEARTLPVVFAPGEIADVSGALTFQSNDPDRPAAVVSLHGAGSAAPVLESVQSELASATAPTLRPDAATRTRSLVLRNPGGAPLEWTASAYQGAVGSRPALMALAAVVLAPAPAGGQRGRAADEFVVPESVPLAAIAQVKGARGPGPAALGNGGPDAFGYRWIDSDAPGGPAFAWQEIASRGVRLFGGADDSTTRIALPFPFTFYGRTYDSVSVCTNGWLSFTDRDSALVNTDLPNAAPGVPRALIAPFWTDLDLRATRGAGRVYAHFDGSKFIVEWKDAVHFAGASPYTFQALLWPNGLIEYQYLSLGALTQAATIGIQDDSGTIGLRVVYNGNYAHTGLRIRLSHQNDWLQLDRTAGTIPPGGVDSLRVTFDAREYRDGDYAGEVRIASNDVVQPLLVVPCAMHAGVHRAAAESQPAAVVAVSQSPLVRFAFMPPLPDAALVPGTLQLNGHPILPARELAHEADGRAVLTLRSVDLLTRMPPDSLLPATLSAEFEPGGWASLSAALSVTQPSMGGRFLPAFGSGEPTRVFRGHEKIDLEWFPPDLGADLYDVAYTSDGGVRWTVVGKSTGTSVGYMVPDTTSRAMLEVVARKGDAVVATFLTDPFVVELEAVGSGEGAPRAFGLVLASASPAHGSVRLGLQLARAGEALAEVFDIRGARVRTLVRGVQPAGRHELVWDGRRDDGGVSPAGLYLVRARSGGETRTLRVAMLR